MKVTNTVCTKSKFYESTQVHYLDLKLEDVEKIDKESVVSVVINSDKENLKRNEMVRIVKIKTPDGEVIDSSNELKEFNSNSELTLFLYDELNWILD